MFWLIMWLLAVLMLIRYTNVITVWVFYSSTFEFKSKNNTREKKKCNINNWQFISVLTVEFWSAVCAFSWLLFARQVKPFSWFGSILTQNNEWSFRRNLIDTYTSNWTSLDSNKICDYDLCGSNPQMVKKTADFNRTTRNVLKTSPWSLLAPANKTKCLSC